MGAPKCGTTALSEYLRNHPNIFMSTPKEIHYFAEEYHNLRRAESLDQYLNFFQDCKKKHLAVGEASPVYLSSQTAINNIRRFNENAKIIVMLRNPVDLCYSLHSQVVFLFYETERDFKTAWKLQHSRRKGLNIPKTCPDPAYLQYSTVCKLGDQVEKVLKIFPPRQVKLILFDDFKTSTKTVYEDVLSFLEVPSDGRSNFPHINENKERERWLTGYLYGFLRKTEPLNSIVNYLKDSFGIKEIGIRARTQRKVKKYRQSISSDFRAELVNEFREDVKKLSRILDRDLSHWY